MNLFRPILPIFAFTFISLLCISAVTGQTVPNTRPDSNFQAVLHVILGSADADQGAALPKSLSGISAQLKSNFSFTNYKLVNTYLGRIADTGTLEYKSMANIYGQEQESETPSSSIGGLADSGGSTTRPGEEFSRSSRSDSGHVFRCVCRRR